MPTALVGGVALRTASQTINSKGRTGKQGHVKVLGVPRGNGVVPRGYWVFEGRLEVLNRSCLQGAQEVR